MMYKAAVKALRNVKAPEECVRSKFVRNHFFQLSLRKVLLNTLDMEQHYHGLTISGLKRLAYQLAIKNQVPNPFLSEAKAGKK